MLFLFTKKNSIPKMNETDLKTKLELVKAHIGEFPDFPIKGILFRDIFTAMTNGAVCTALKDLLLDHVKKACPDVDVIVGLDARGFLFGFLVAAELGVAFVPIRKKGKLPGQCHSYEYKLEYGSDTFQIQANSIRGGQKVVIVDDLLATGGTISAACHLIEQAGGVVAEIVVVLELKSLNGRAKVGKQSIHSFLQYD